MTDQQPYTNGTQQDMPRRLYKSRYNKMIDGVCGGIAEYFEIDPTIVRILWVVITFSGIGFFLYIAGMIIMPVNLSHLASPQPPSARAGRSEFDQRRFWGITLILIGSFFLISQLGLFASISWWKLSWKFFFPGILILAGISLVGVELKKRQSTASNPFAMPSSSDAPPSNTYVPRKELRRSKTDRKLFGVCGGIAQYLGLDSTVIRVIFFILIFASFGWALPLYIVLALLMPEEKIIF